MVLAGGVGGARMARGFARVCPPQCLTIVVNVGDDDDIYGVHVSADIDTVTYTLAGLEGPHGWGMRDDTFVVMDGLARLGVDTSFRLGDRDLATCLWRTNRLAAGEPLSSVTAEVTSALGVHATVTPATDEPVRTEIQIDDGSWLSFQDYFVTRGHRDRVLAIRFAGADKAAPAPGVAEAVRESTMVVIAPSNPPLSIWPQLAVPGIREAVASASRVVAVSPLIGGRALKGPAAAVMDSLGLPSGTAGVLAAYDGLVTHLVVDLADAEDAGLHSGNIAVMARDIRIASADAAARLATELLAV